MELPLNSHNTPNQEAPMEDQNRDKDEGMPLVKLE